MLDVALLLARQGFIKEFGIVIENRDHISPATVLTFEIILMSTIKGAAYLWEPFLFRFFIAQGLLCEGSVASEKIIAF